MSGEQVKPGYKRSEVGVIPEDWGVRPFGELTATVASGRSTAGIAFGNYPVHGSTGIIGFHEKPEYEGDAILIARVGANAGKLKTVTGKYGVTDNTIIVRIKGDSSLPFFYRQLESKRLNSLVFGSGQPLITGSQLKALIVCEPSLPEQRAIAAALSDVDALLAQLDQLITKKRDLKEAAMQQLLSGQTRLPGFFGDWEVKRLGDLLRVRHGKDQKAIEVPDGKYPILATGGEIGRTNTSLHDKPSVLIGRKGTIDRPMYMDTPFWTVDTLFYTEINSRADTKFLYYQFLLIDWYAYNAASGVPSLNASTIENIEIQVPDLSEQTAIATVLSDMDTELTALEARRDKTRALKQGMMQELLTGRIRLV